MRRDFTLLLFYNLLLSTAFVANGSTEKEPKTVLGIKECLVIAFENNTKLQLAELSLESSQSLLQEQKRIIRPNLSSNSSYNMGSSFGANPNDATYGTTLQLNQPIFSGGQNKLMIRVAQSSIDLAQTSTQDQRLQVTEQVYMAYLNVVLAKEIARLANLRLELSNSLYKEVKARIDVGLGRKAEALRLESELSFAQTQALSSTNDIEIQLEALMSWLGIRGTFDVMPIDTLIKEIDLSLPTDFKSTLMNSSPQWAALEIQEQISQLQFDLSKRSTLPVLNGIASSGYGNIQSFNPDFFWAAGLNLVIPLYSGGSLNARQQTRNIELRTIKKQQQDFLTDRLAAIKQASYRRASALSNITTMEAQLNAATTNVTLSREEYKNGLRRLLDVIDVQTTYFQSEINLLQARTDYLMNTIQIQRLLGIL